MDAQRSAERAHSPDGDAGGRVRRNGGPDDRNDAREDRPLGELDDLVDREELQRRYYGLLQELRVLLPGVQILVAFLLTVPFADAFDELDQMGQYLYGVSLLSGVLAVIVFVAPTVFHRMGPRQSRVARMRWAVRMLRAGLVLFAVSLLSAVGLIWRFVFGTAPMVPIAIVVLVAMLGIWIALPRESLGAHGSSRDI